MGMSKRLHVAVTVLVVATSWAMLGRRAAVLPPPPPTGSDDFFLGRGARRDIEIEWEKDGGLYLSLENVTPLELAALGVIAAAIIAGHLIGRKKRAKRGLVNESDGM